MESALGKKKDGESVKTWRRLIEEEKITWNTAEKMAASRVFWQNIFDAIFSTRSLKD